MVSKLRVEDHFDPVNSKVEKLDLKEIEGELDFDKLQLKDNKVKEVEDKIDSCDSKVKAVVSVSFSPAYKYFEDINRK